MDLLPKDILIEISNYLDLYEVTNLRLCCKNFLQLFDERRNTIIINLTGLLIYFPYVKTYTGDKLCVLIIGFLSKEQFLQKTTQICDKNLGWNLVYDHYYRDVFQNLQKYLTYKIKICKDKPDPVNEDNPYFIPSLFHGLDFPIRMETLVKNIEIRTVEEIPYMISGDDYTIRYLTPYMIGRESVIKSCSKVETIRGRLINIPTEI